jgi:mono/diheme cytochrome c family protein
MNWPGKRMAAPSGCREFERQDDRSVPVVAACSPILDFEMEDDRMKRLFVTGVVAVCAVWWLIAGNASAVRAQDAKQAYEKTCVPCHGASGKGDGPVGKMLKPPPKDFATGIKGASDADLAKIIKEGGKAVGKAATMPAYGTKMSDEQIQGLVQYIKGLK